jgi:hypothetical protein
MKTLHENQNWSMSLKPDSTFIAETHRPKIGDDDGISNQVMNALIVLFILLTLGVSILSATAHNAAKYRIIPRQAMLDMDWIEYDKALIKLHEVRAFTDQVSSETYHGTARIAAYLNYMSCIPLASLEHKSMVVNRIKELKNAGVEAANGGNGFLANLKP